MNYIITADTKPSWTIDGLETSYAVIFKDKDSANKRWVDMKQNSYFKNMRACKAENVKQFELTLLQTKQGKRPLFATVECSSELIRLFSQVYGSVFAEHYTYVLPDVEFEKMEFDYLEEINPETYKVDDEYEYFNRISVVREKTFGSKFYQTERFARYDEILTNREDVCEIRLHPYCSDFNLVSDIELEYMDYDM